MLRADGSTRKMRLCWMRAIGVQAAGGGRAGGHGILLDIPADLPRDYELRLIVYDAATLSPTVELLWEPEVVLARRLVEGG